jgi:hypothetical protein
MFGAVGKNTTEDFVQSRTSSNTFSNRSVGACLCRIGRVEYVQEKSDTLARRISTAGAQEMQKTV